MKVQSINNQSFSAKILPSPYLEQGIQYAKELAPLKDKNEFANALEWIKNTKTFKTFKITTVEGSKLEYGKPRRYRVELDGRKSYTDIGKSGQVYDGPQCMLAIKDFVYRRQGFDGLKIMDSATTKWMEKYRELQQQLKEVAEYAKEELNSKIEELMK